MAKKTDEAGKPRGRPKSANPKPPTPIVMTIRGKPEWEIWLDGLREAVRSETGLSRVERTDVVDIALRELAARLDQPEPPARY